jgi:UrcA family protein
MNTRHIAIALVATFAAATASSAAEAKWGSSHRAQAVTYADLDLGRAEDAARLHTRIFEAAQDICANPRGRSALEGRDRASCIRSAVQGAVDRLDRPALTEAHLNRFAWASVPGSRVEIRIARR